MKAFYSESPILSAMKICRVCETELKDENWSRRNRDDNRRICRKCESEKTKLFLAAHPDYAKKWREANPDKAHNRKYKINDETRAKIREYHHRLKIEVLTHYGGNPPHCIRCGYADTRALSVDHVNGGGTQHLRLIGKSHYYGWLKKNGYPAGFQVLCMNCQFIKRSENHETYTHTRPAEIP